MGKPRALHRLKQEALAAAAKEQTVAAAARAVGVDRVTFHRWIGAGLVPRPGGTARERAAVSAAESTGQDVGRDWAARIREKYELTPAEGALLALAEAAYAMAADPAARPQDRTSAMAKFISLVQAIHLPREEEAHGEIETPARRWPARVG